MTKPEEIKPYDHSRGKTEQVRQMFDNIAPAYDFMNRAMTLGIDRRWRRIAVDMVARQNPASVVDIATGTGDMAIAIARAVPGANVTGIDLSEGMIEIGRRKISDLGLAARVELHTGDCLANPLPPAKADAVTVAYGVRNFADLPAGYRAMLKMLRPGGMLCVIELSVPASPLVKPFYNLYTRFLIPAVGRLVSRDHRAYSYLPESIRAVPAGNKMLALMQQAGFTNTSFRPLTFGVCTIYTGFRPKDN